MSRAVPAAVEPRLREAGAAEVPAQHEGDRSGDVAFECQRHQVVHQAEVRVLALGKPERYVGRGLLDRVVHRDANPALQLANVVDVAVDAHLTAGAKAALDRPELTDNGVEDTRVALPIAPALLGARAVT